MLYGDDVTNYHYTESMMQVDYCVKEITFCNNSSSSATPEVMELIQIIICEIKSTELIISNFSFTDLQGILKKVMENNINLSFLRIEEIDKFDEKLFLSSNIPSVVSKQKYLFALR